MSYRSMQKRINDRAMAAETVKLRRSIRSYERFPFPKIGALALLLLVMCGFTAGLLAGKYLFH